MGTSKRNINKNSPQIDSNKPSKQPRKNQCEQNVSIFDFLLFLIKIKNRKTLGIPRLSGSCLSYVIQM